MIYEAYERCASTLVGKDSFHVIPRYGDPAWDRLGDSLRRPILARAEADAGKNWPALPATLYMDFVKNGNRSRYQAVYFERRSRLFCLALAEMLEHRGRFIDDIIDGIWAICEETTWCVPAHTGKGSVPDDALVDIARDPVTLDLFAAETGAMMAWIYAMLGEKLGEICRQIPLRMEHEINNRIFVPYETRDDFWWMGFDPTRTVNNWNPWINANVLATLLLVEPDDVRRRAMTAKLCRSADVFLNVYAPDGGCDEGPSYFSVAGGALIDFLELMYLATDGQLDLSREEIIVNMADYIRHVHIAGDYFVNFADSPMRLGGGAECALLRLSRRMGNRELESFCLMRLAGRKEPLPVSVITSNYTTCLFRQLMGLFDWDEDALKNPPMTASLGHWFGGIQVAAARTKENSFDGLFIAAKGGCNQESHNHNDIGNFIIYLGGQPVIGDAGVGEYTKKTFSSERYDIWSMQSGWHNTAVINGCDQLPGLKYAAADVQYSDDGRVMRMSMDIAPAYGAEAAVDSYHRVIRFDRTANEITVADDVNLREVREPLRVTLLCAEKPTLAPGEARIGALHLRFDGESWAPSVQERPLEDEKLISAWGKDSLWRLTLTDRHMSANPRCSMTFTL